MTFSAWWESEGYGRFGSIAHKEAAKLCWQAGVLAGAEAQRAKDATIARSINECCECLDESCHIGDDCRIAEAILAAPLATAEGT